MRRLVLLLAGAVAFALLAGCQASVTPGAASKTSFDRIYELSPSVNAYVDKAFFAKSPRRVAVLPFVYRPRPGFFSDDDDEGVVVEGDRGPTPVARPPQGNPDQAALISTHTERPAPGGFSPDAELVRRAFYGQFAALEFRDVELQEVDRRLQEAGIVTPEQMESVEPRRLGELLGADALIYGTVHEMSVAYVVLYSQIAIGLSLQLVSADDGSVLWKVDEVGRKHSFQIALGPVGLIAGAVRSGLALRPINITRTAEDLSRDIVQTFPTRASLADFSGDSYEILAVEADGTSNHKRYGDVVSVRVTATPGRRAWFDLSRVARNVRLREVEPGLYAGHYAVHEGDVAARPILTVYLGPEDSPQYYRWVQKRLDLRIDTVPPRPPADLRLRREGNGLLLLWAPSPSKDLKVYRLYRKGFGGRVELLGTTNSTSYFVGRDASPNTALVVTAVDEAGNESAGAEVVLTP